MTAGAQGDNYLGRILIKIVLVVGGLVSVYYFLPPPTQALLDSFWSYIRDKYGFRKTRVIASPPQAGEAI